MPRAEPTNVINFASRAASAKAEAKTQRQRELAFKLITEGNKRSRAKSTTDELIQDILEWRLIADSLSRTAKTWQRLYQKSERELKSANKKIAKLEAQLANLRSRTA